jgi:hypothetical protein
MTVLPDGGLMLAGSSVLAGDEGDPFRTDVAIWFVGPDGVINKHRRLETESLDGAADIAVAADGSMYLTGSSAVSGDAPSDLLVLKLDADGTEAWRHTRGDRAYDEGTSIALGADGSVYVLGVVDRPGFTGGPRVNDTGPDLYLAKLSPAGEFAWERSFPVPGDESPAGMIIGADGSVYVTGSIIGRPGHEGNIPRESLLFVAKYTADGEPVWERRYDTQGDDYARDIAAGPDGGLYIAGMIADTTDGDTVNQIGHSSMNRLLLARLTPDGAIDWVQAMPFDVHTFANVSLAAAADGRLVVASTFFDEGKDATRPDIAVVEFGDGG